MSDDVFLSSYLLVWVNVTIGTQTIPLLNETLGDTAVLWMTPDIAVANVLVRVDVEDPFGARASDTRTVSLTRQPSLATVVAALLGIVFGQVPPFSFLQAPK